jgi:hypothetical protein
VALPAGFKELGLISTDGFVLADSLSTENTDADQRWSRCAPT